MEYIRLPKELLSSQLWMFELNSDTKIFFIHLLSKATHKMCRAPFMGEIFELEVGEVVITQRKLAKALDIKEYQIKKEIFTLKVKGLISTSILQSTHVNSAHYY